MGARSEKSIFNSALSFRKHTHFRLCLLETQVTGQPLLTASLHLTVVPGLGSQSPGTGEEVMDTHS